MLYDKRQSTTDKRLLLKKRAGNSEGANAALSGKPRRSNLIQRNVQRYRAIVEGSDDAIISKTLDGVITTWNRGAEQIFGYSAAEMIGQSIAWIIPLDLLEEEQFIMAQLKQGRRVHHFETTRLARDGRRVPVSLTISPIHDARGVTIGASKVARDISERKRVEEMAREAAEGEREARREAERANRAKTDFLAVMSHEIRTPLTSISGFVNMLMSSDNLTREQRRFVDLIGTANAALQTVVDDILDFSKVESGQIELESRKFAPRTLVHDTLAITTVVAAEKNLRLRYFIERDTPEWVMGDDSRLRQVLLNLLNNAIKFTSSGSIEVRLVTELSSAGESKLRFSVLDTGVGIPDEQQKRLFKQFSQADNSISRRFGGTGLGLAICKRLVNLMGGDIGVASVEGRGSTFWFNVPLVEAHAPTWEADEIAEPEEVGAVGTRILVVDDIAANREIVKAYLGERGYRVDTVGSAVDAIQMLGAETFDIVLMDIQMPVMDGITATKRIRALPKPMRDVPILAMTGNVLPTQVKAFLEAGMNDHVAKPISRAKLFHSVRLWGKKNDALAEPASEAPAAEDDKLQELIGALGNHSAAKIVNIFLRDLNAAFAKDGDLDGAKRDAHALINCAGIVGLTRFVDACRAIEGLPPADAGSDREALARIRAERALAHEIVVNQVLPKLAVPSLQWAG